MESNLRESDRLSVLRQVDEGVLTAASEPLYADFGTTLLAEHLDRRFGLVVSPDTPKRRMLGAGLWERRRRRAKHRSRRPRRAALGEPGQWDSSVHPWLDERAAGSRTPIPRPASRLATSRSASRTDAGRSPSGRPPASPPGDEIVVERHFKGETRSRFGERYLDVEPASRRPVEDASRARPPSRGRAPPRPGPEHSSRKHFQAPVRPAIARRHRRREREATSNGKEPARTPEPTRVRGNTTAPREDIFHCALTARTLLLRFDLTRMGSPRTLRFTVSLFLHLASGIRRPNGGDPDHRQGRSNEKALRIIRIFIRDSICFRWTPTAVHTPRSIWFSRTLSLFQSLFLPPDRLLGVSSDCAICGMIPFPRQYRCNGTRTDSCSHPAWDIAPNGDPIVSWSSHSAWGQWGCGQCPDCPPTNGGGGGEDECDSGMELC